MASALGIKLARATLDILSGNFLRLLRLGDCNSTDKENSDETEYRFVHGQPASNATGMPQREADENEIFPGRRPGVSLFDYQGESNLIRLRMDGAAGTYPVAVIGSVKVNVEPLPASLSTQIFPPCSSTNFLAKVNPSPVPSTLCA